MEEIDSIFYLIVILGGIAASLIIRIIFLIKHRKKQEIKFDEFQDTEKIKERDVVEKEEMKHETKVIDEAYKAAYYEASLTNFNPITGVFSGIEAAEKAQEDLGNFKIIDQVEVDEEEVNEGTPIHNLKENGNNFEIELFKKWAIGIFGCIKIGTEEQLKVVKAFMTDELYSKFYMQAKAFEKDGLAFVTEELMIKKCSIYDYGRSLDKEEVKILIDANMKEYIKKKSDHEVLRGSKDNFSNKKVLLTFQKKKSEAEEGLIRNCPNCGTTVDQTELGKCKYCGTIILPIRYNWTLTKFETM